MSLPVTQSDLYEVLGISHYATPEEIKRAYRKAAKFTHPDAGGTPEKFAQVQHAYNVLSNPDRRARYDATGDAKEVQPDNQLAQIHALIMGAIDRVIQGGDIECRDIVAAAVTLLGHDRAEGLHANKQLSRKKCEFEKIRKRFKFKGDGTDLIDRTFADRIADIDRSIATNEQVMEQVAEAIERLRDGWEYEVEIRQTPVWATSSARIFNIE